MRTLFYIGVLVYSLVVCMLVRTGEAKASLTYEERGEVYRKQVAAEVQRHHELEMEKAKIEILYRLKEAGASKISVTAVNRNTNTTTQHTEVTNA